MSKYNISNELKQEILINLIEPNIKADIATNFKLKKIFKKIGLTFETMSKLFVGIASILSFATGVYHYTSLSFLSGTSSVISLVLLQYSSYAYRESKKNISEINTLLSKLNIDIDIKVIGSEDSTSEKGSIEPNTPLINKNF
jgi:hypothetical protein